MRMHQSGATTPISNPHPRRLGGTRLKVSALGMGTAGLGGLYQEVSFDAAQATLNAAWNAGIRYFDSAPFYGYGKSEHYLGHALRNWLRHCARDQFVVSTKVGRVLKSRARPGASARDHNDGWGDPFPFEPVFDYSYDGVMRSFEDSQQRLGLDRIDLLLVHDIGRLTHAQQHARHWHQLAGGGFKALDELRAAGMVAAIGLGVNENQVVLDAMCEFSLDCCLLAGRYTLLDQTALEQLLPECERRRVSVLLGGPFNSGILASGAASSGRYNYGEAPPAVREKVVRLQHSCEEFGVTLAAAALQFPYAHPQIASVVSGARSAPEMQANAAYFMQPIPREFWKILRQRGLLDERAPLPDQQQTPSDHSDQAEHEVGRAPLTTMPDLPPT